MRIQIPAWKPRFLRYSPVEDVHPLPPHALDPALPRAALRLALRQVQDFQLRTCSISAISFGKQYSENGKSGVALNSIAAGNFDF